MAVRGADGQELGTIERVEGDALYANGQRITLDAIQRIDAGTVYLWGDRAVYDAAENRGDAQQTQAMPLPNTEAQLYVNEREVEQSLEERLPRDGRR
jgi:hypothetical protein